MELGTIKTAISRRSAEMLHSNGGTGGFVLCVLLLSRCIERMCCREAATIDNASINNLIADRRQHIYSISINKYIFKMVQNSENPYDMSGNDKQLVN